MADAPLKIPENLAPLFWDVDPVSVDPARHRTVVIERVLEYGDDGAVAWLLQTYTVSAVADVVRSSRALSRNTAGLWALVLDIPREEIRCFSLRSLLRQGSFSNG